CNCSNYDTFGPHGNAPPCDSWFCYDESGKLLRNPTEKRNFIQPAVQHDQTSCRNEDPHCDHHDAAANFQRVQMTSDSGLERQKPLKPKRLKKNRNRKTKCINPKQRTSFSQRRFCRGEREDYRQDWTHARRPPEAEGCSNEKRPRARNPAGHAVKAFRTV